MEPLQETSKAAEAYRAYEALGVDRSLAKLAIALYGAAGKNGAKVGQLERWSAKYGWSQRACAYDAQQRERERALEEQARADIIKRRAARDARREAARERMDDDRAEVFHGEWLKLLKTINAKVDAGDMKGLVALGSLLSRALDEERLSLGSPTQVTAMTGADGGPIEVADVTERIQRRLSGLALIRGTTSLPPVIDAGRTESA